MATQMENSLIESLRELGHETSVDVLRAGIEDARFRKVLIALAAEIHVLGETEEQLTGDTDLGVLAIELSSLLSELNCPFESLVSGNIGDRFCREGCNVLDYLSTELMALQMYHSNRKQTGNGHVIELHETPTAVALKGMSDALGMEPPPVTLATDDLFHRLDTRIGDLLAKVGRERVGKPLLTPGTPWTAKQWQDLEKRHSELDKEYDLRREMLLTRLDCTVQAFNWSERMKHKQSHILETYRTKLQVLEGLVQGGANTDIVALLASRDLLLAIEKASSAAVLKNTKSKIQRHIIGTVPDRGGRAWEHAPPPPEMPSWQKQRATGGQGGGRGGQQGGRGGYGGRGGGGGQGNNRGGRGAGGAGNQNYDSNRGGGQRVQSGWSQRGGGGGVGGDFDSNDGGFNRGGRGGGHRGGGRYNNNNNNTNYRGARNN